MNKKFEDIVSTDSETMGGTPVFKNSRVPIQAYFDYLQGGDSLENFLEDFPTVNKEQVIDLLNFITFILSDIDIQGLLNENTFRRKHPDQTEAIAI